MGAPYRTIRHSTQVRRVRETTILLDEIRFGTYTKPVARSQRQISKCSRVGSITPSSAAINSEQHRFREHGKHIFRPFCQVRKQTYADVAEIRSANPDSIVMPLVFSGLTKGSFR